jgi:hypothetical protein
MPITPTYPGVYIEEIPSGVQTIVGVATSIGAFFGRTAKGPLNKSVRCFNYSDFTRVFGGAHKSSELAQSLRQFFNNGGTDCYVIRLADKTTAAPSSVTLQAQVNSTTLVNALTAAAKGEGKWGNTIRLVVDYNTPNPDETFNLKAIHEVDGNAASTESFLNLSMDPNSSRFAPDFVTQSSELIKLELHADVASGGTTDITVPANSFNGFSQARRPLSTVAVAVSGSFLAISATTVHDTLDALINPTSATTPRKYNFDISVDGSAYVTVDLSQGTLPATHGLILTFIENAIRVPLQAVNSDLDITCSYQQVSDMGRIFTITSTGANSDKSSVRVRRSSSNDIAEALMLGIDQGGIEAVRWSNFRPVPNATYIDYIDASASPPHNLTVVNNIGTLERTAFNEISIDGEDISLSGDYTLETTVSVHPNFRWFKSNQAGDSVHDYNDGIREKLRIIAKAVNNQKRFVKCKTNQF